MHFARTYVFSTGFAAFAVNSHQSDLDVDKMF